MYLVHHNYSVFIVGRNDEVHQKLATHSAGGRINIHTFWKAIWEYMENKKNVILFEGIYPSDIIRDAELFHSNFCVQQ